RSPRSTLVPYTTLFRSQLLVELLDRRRSRRGALSGGALTLRDLNSDHRRRGLRNRYGRHLGCWDRRNLGGLDRGELRHSNGRERSEEHTSELQSLAYLV